VVQVVGLLEERGPHLAPDGLANLQGGAIPIRGVCGSLSPNPPKKKVSPKGKPLSLWSVCPEQAGVLEHEGDLSGGSHRHSSDNVLRVTPKAKKTGVAVTHYGHVSDKAAF